jgi:hypothetical protein
MSRTFYIVRTPDDTYLDKTLSDDRESTWVRFGMHYGGASVFLGKMHWRAAYRNFLNQGFSIEVLVEATTW